MFLHFHFGLRRGVSVGDFDRNGTVATGLRRSVLLRLLLLLIGLCSIFFVGFQFLPLLIPFQLEQIFVRRVRNSLQMNLLSRKEGFSRMIWTEPSGKEDNNFTFRGQTFRNYLNSIQRTHPSFRTCKRLCGIFGLSWMSLDSTPILEIPGSPQRSVDERTSKVYRGPKCKEYCMQRINIVFLIITFKDSDTSVQVIIKLFICPYRVYNICQGIWRWRRRIAYLRILQNVSGAKFEARDPLPVAKMFRILTTLRRRN